MKFQLSEVSSPTEAEGQCCWQLDVCSQNQPIKDEQSVSSAKGGGQHEMWLLSTLWLVKGGVRSSGFLQGCRSRWSWTPIFYQSLQTLWYTHIHKFIGLCSFRYSLVFFLKNQGRTVWPEGIDEIPLGTEAKMAGKEVLDLDKIDINGYRNNLLQFMD